MCLVLRNSLGDSPETADLGGCSNIAFSPKDKTKSSSDEFLGARLSSRTPEAIFTQVKRLGI